MRKNKWVVKHNDPAAVKRLMEQTHVSSVLANLLINRGYTDPQAIEEFLYPDLHNLSSPFELLNMGAAVEKILLHVEKQHKIVVYGDYDVDGICASVILYQGLLSLGGVAEYYVPDRLEEGYGLNMQAVENIVQSGVELLITVDCGISASAEIQQAQEMGLDVIVTDHHQLPPDLPECIIVDPAMNPTEGAWKYLCGAGVAFKLVQGLFERHYHEADSLYRMTPYLDLAALATVADIVALKGDNRILVKFGLEEMKHGQRAGIAALWKVSRNNESADLNTIAVGFNMAPRLNACGRIGDVRLGLRLLTTDDPVEAEEIAYKLDAENKNRQEIEREIFEEALVKVASGKPDLHKGLIVIGDDWHPGVIGIVASRLVEQFYTPTIVLTKVNGLYKGSGRSIEGFHLQQALAQCADCLENYGGHAQAAGLSVQPEKLAVFQQRFAEVVQQSTTTETFIPTLYIDGELSVNDLNNDIYDDINKLQPTGTANTLPVFVCRSQTTTEVRCVGATGDHLRIKLRTNQGEIVGIGFKKAELETVIAEGSIDIAFHLDKNYYNGKTSLQMVIKDIKSFRRPDQMDFVDRLFYYQQDYLQDAPYRGIENQDSFYTKAAGVSFEGRQELVKTLQEGCAVQLRREADNQYDPNAIALYYQDQQIGYLKRELAKNLAPVIDQGTVYQAVVSQITGGEGKNYGVNLLIKKQQMLDELLKQCSQEDRAILCTLNDQTLLEKIKNTLLGPNDYRLKQKEAIQKLLAHKNVLAILGTGRGKSAIFQTYAAYLALKKQQMTVIIYPLRALVNDQYQTLQSKLAPLGLTVVKGTGALESDDRAEFFQQLQDKQVDIVLTTPEFFCCHYQRFLAEEGHVGLVVVDEAHHLQSRRIGYKQLPQVLGKLFKVQVLAVTATANEETAAYIRSALSIDQWVIDTHIRDNLRIDDQRQNMNKIGFLLDLATTGEKTVVYVNSRKQAVKIAQMLREKMPQEAQQMICYYHGGLNNADRQAIEIAFKSGSLRLIVTTSAFGEGIDIPDIRHVVLYHLSFSLEEYNQLAGRAGRDGNTSTIHLLYGERDEALNRMLLAGTCPSRDNLVQFYLLLKQLTKQKNHLEQTNQQLAELAEKRKIAGLTENSVSHWLGIFEELGFLEREREGSKRSITMNPKPAKVDLENSLRYQEGLAELDDYKRYLQLAFQKDEAQLLAAVNQPIYPKSWVEQGCDDL